MQGPETSGPAQMRDKLAYSFGEDLFRSLAVGQGSFYLITGIWPLIHMPSFLKVTGPKADLWLVRTVGALIAVVGAVLTSAGFRNKRNAEFPLLAAGVAASLTAIDIIYVARRRIPPVYLMDALAEIPLIAGWGVVAWRMRAGRHD